MEEEIKRLEKQGIIVKVEHSEWAAPVVPIVKRDGKIRLCGDYKLTFSKVDLYALPKIDDILSSLSGGVYFTKLDLSNAYQQVVLDERSQTQRVVQIHVVTLWSFIGSWVVSNIMIGNLCLFG